MDLHTYTMFAAALLGLIVLVYFVGPAAAMILASLVYDPRREN